MVSQKVSDLLNHQINKEFYSAYLYLAFSDKFLEKGLPGIAHWYTVQAEEELRHGKKILNYMEDNHLPVLLAAIGQPQSLPESCGEIFRLGLSHEEYITDSINRIYDAASEDGDYRTMRFLDWFIDEQQEEELNAEELLNKMRIIGTNGQGVYMLDRELGERE